ncbi:MAG TPA: diguanylate cyclase, partial [Albitalea sp.]|nr:diguanylate cyclase [Albitalea sp.]
YFSSLAVFPWLVLEAHRLWAEHGPCAQLLPSAAYVPYLLVGRPQDYRGAYESARHLVAVGDARGFEPGTSLARSVFAMAAVHWVEPIENAIEAFRRAREDLLRDGDIPYVSYTYLASDLLLDSAPTLDAAATEIDAGLAYAARTHNAAYTQRYLPRRQLIRALRGDTREPGAFSDDSFDEADHVKHLGPPGTTSVTYHIMRAISAALFDDREALAHHAAQAMPTLGRLPGFYITALARVLQAVALAEKARTLPPEERGPVLDELDDTCGRWLALRAGDAPLNFLHLQRWVEAERAWAAHDIWAAGAAFDTAMHEAAQRPRPWHRALIIERAARFHLAQGMEGSGRALLAQACELYEAWGAVGKANALRHAHAFLRGAAAPTRADFSVRSTSVPTDVVDMVAVLRASQALSSQTSLSRLTDRVGMVLSAMTGATRVQLLVRPDDNPGWFMAASLGDGGNAVSVEQAGADGELPLSVFRYAERTGEVVLLDDATRDDRFAADPYVARLEQCSMLVAPILKHGELHAMLMLESRHLRAAFSVERLDAITLIAGQLSVSLDNALLYASLERKVAERTAALEEANRRLERLSLTDALTGLANRRRFNDTLDAEWLRAARSKSPLGLAIADIDFFKPYNDHYGHQRGDACLQRVADALGTGRRGGSDLVARYGGEEFVLLLPNTDLEGTFLVADRVRAAVEALADAHGESSHGIVTISVGIASCVPVPGSKPAELIEAADAALYEAKRAGRNRVAPQSNTGSTSSLSVPRASS